MRKRSEVAANVAEKVVEEFGREIMESLTRNIPERNNPAVQADVDPKFESLGTRVPDVRANGFDPGVDEGTTVTVTWAEEQFQPVSFNTFRVGPFMSSTKVRPGETVAHATIRLHAELDVAAQQVLREKSAAYLRSLKGIAEQASRTR